MTAHLPSSFDWIGTANLFDRRSGSLHPRSAYEATRCRLLQLSSASLAPIKHLGISRVHGLINRLLPSDSWTTVTDGSWSFSYPSGDYYWNRLLLSNWDYEPDIDFFLRSVKNIPFVFIDCGANFGYWTTRIAGDEHGRHRCIAVEPSPVCLTSLQRNVERISDRVSIIDKAIYSSSGCVAPLFGSRHAGYSLSRNWNGDTSIAHPRVTTITIDDLLVDQGIDSMRTPVIVKLDIEGVEISAMSGATDAIAGDTMFIVEDFAEGGPESDLYAWVTERGMFVYALNADGYSLLTSREKFKGHRRFGRQSRSLNFAVTRSRFWIEQLRLARDR
ncbi:MAG: FkbM family methyltransferase [Rhodospirillales bacterium]|jgi:FkbM family methyltransferase